MPSTGPSGLCWAHDPANAGRRRRGQSRGGKNKPSRELASLKTQLVDLTQDVIAGELETGRAAVANQLINTRLRAIELERKIREQDELLTRIEALEDLRQGSLESKRMHTR